jgi:hypothetical protein
MVIDVEEDSAFEPDIETIRENTDGFTMVKDVGTYNFETWGVISTANLAIDDIKYKFYCDYYLFRHDTKKTLNLYLNTKKILLFQKTMRETTTI